MIGSVCKKVFFLALLGLVFSMPLMASAKDGDDDFSSSSSASSVDSSESSSSANSSSSNDSSKYKCDKKKRFEKELAFQNRQLERLNAEIKRAARRDAAKKRRIDEKRSAAQAGINQAALNCSAKK